VPLGQPQRHTNFSQLHPIKLGTQIHISHPSGILLRSYSAQFKLTTTSRVLQDHLERMSIVAMASSVPSSTITLISISQTYQTSSFHHGSHTKLETGLPCVVTTRVAASVINVSNDPTSLPSLDVGVFEDVHVVNANTRFTPGPGVPGLRGA
jgi:hypothetical protein